MDFNVNAPFMDKFSDAVNNLANAIVTIGSPKAAIEKTFGPLDAAAAASRAAVKPAPAVPMPPVQLPPQAPKAPAAAQYPAPTYPQTVPLNPGVASIPINKLPYGVPGGAQAYVQQVNAMIPPASAPTQPTPAPAAPTAESHAFTFDDLARAASSLMDAGKQQQLLGLLQQFGIQRLDQLPKERCGEFATALRGLGARL